jgi:hypothetical protein
VDSNSKFPGVFSEKDWNVSSGEVIKEQGRNAPQRDKYRASKALAERGEYFLSQLSLSKAKWVASGLEMDR